MKKVLLPNSRLLERGRDSNTEALVLMNSKVVVAIVIAIVVIMMGLLLGPLSEDLFSTRVVKTLHA